MIEETIPDRELQLMAYLANADRTARTIAKIADRSRDGLMAIYDSAAAEFRVNGSACAERIMGIVKDCLNTDCW